MARIVLEIREDADAPSQVAHLRVGDRVQPKAVRARPARTAALSEADLIALLQQHGIGRPATYELIADALIKHGYATREGNGLRVTELGAAVASFLAEHGNGVFDLGFTATFEAQLDGIAVGEDKYVAVLRTLHNKLQSIG